MDEFLSALWKALPAIMSTLAGYLVYKLKLVDQKRELEAKKTQKLLDTIQLNLKGTRTALQCIPSAPVKTQTGTIVRTVCLTLALINQLLVAAGYKALPISDDQVNTVISTCITIGVSLWTWWKNNSFTKAAIKADQTLRDIKNG